MCAITIRVWYKAAVCGLFVLLVGYSLYALTESPPAWFDEGIYIQAAQALTTHGSQSIQVAPGAFASSSFITGGYPFLLPVAASLTLFGQNLFAARLPMVLFILLLAIAAFSLLYRIAGRKSALLGLLLFATFPLLYGNGKNVLGEVPGLLYTTLALLCLWRIESQNFKGALRYALLGLSVGLAVATKPIFILLPLAIGIVWALRARSVPLRWKEIVAGFCAFVLPIAIWLFLQFDARDSISSVLYHYANPYAIAPLWQTILQNLLRFFHEATPLYCAGLMALWAAACAVRLWRRERILFTELVAFVFSLLVLAAYVRTAGWYRYFFEAMTLALLFAPASLRVIAGATGEYAPRIKKYLVFAPLLLIVLALIQFYQLNYSSWVAEHYRSTTTAQLEHYFESQPKDASYFVYNAPEVVLFLPTAQYYQYIEATPTLAYGQENFPLLVQGVPDRVIVSQTDYEKNAALFVRYTPGDAAGSYLVLKRK